MKRPGWLDREYRIRSLTVQLRAKSGEAKLWFRQYVRLTHDLTLARAERDNARVRVAELEARHEGVPT